MVWTSQPENTRFTSKQQGKQRLPLHDEEGTGTSDKLPREHVIQRMQRELDLLRETITKQNEKTASLERKPGHLDSNIVVLESCFALENHVTDVLREQLDDQEQHSRLPCLMYQRLPEWNQSVCKNIRYWHLQISDITEYNVQNNIRKFTKHSTAK